MKGLLDKPKIIGIVGDVNTGKSMLLYNILEQVAKKHTFKLYYYGLRLDFDKVDSQRIYSVAELEAVRDSLIIVDELSSLFDLDNRKIKRIIENTLRLINHNNNILIACGTPENFKKFLSAKCSSFIYKKCTIADFINGSNVKNILNAYKGSEKGSELLNLKVDECLVYSEGHYIKEKVSYLKKYDSKKEKVNIFVPKNEEIKNSRR